MGPRSSSLGRTKTIYCFLGHAVVAVTFVKFDEHLLRSKLIEAGPHCFISPVNLGFDLEQIATEMIFAGSNSLNSAS